MLAVDRHPVRAARAGDEALIDARAVQVRPPDRVAGAVGPVDVLAVDRHPERAARAGDEALIDARAVEVRPPDRAAAAVGPVHVLAVDRHLLRGARAGDQHLVDARAVQVRPPDRAAGGVGPVDERVSLRRQAPPHHHHRERHRERHHSPPRPTNHHNPPPTRRRWHPRSATTPPPPARTPFIPRPHHRHDHLIPTPAAQPTPPHRTPHPRPHPPSTAAGQLDQPTIPDRHQRRPTRPIHPQQHAGTGPPAEHDPREPDHPRPGPPAASAAPTDFGASLTTSNTTARPCSPTRTRKGTTPRQRSDCDGAAPYGTEPAARRVAARRDSRTCPPMLAAAIAHCRDHATPPPPPRPSARQRAAAPSRRRAARAAARSRLPRGRPSSVPSSASGRRAGAHVFPLCRSCFWWMMSVRDLHRLFALATGFDRKYTRDSSSCSRPAIRSIALYSIRRGGPPGP